MNETKPVNPENLVRVPFTEAIPDVTWYRHPTWEPGKYKRFRHRHTMASNSGEFEMYSEPTKPSLPVAKEPGKTAIQMLVEAAQRALDRMPYGSAMTAKMVQEAIPKALDAEKAYREALEGLLPLLETADRCGRGLGSEWRSKTRAIIGQARQALGQSTQKVNP